MNIKYTKDQISGSIVDLVNTVRQDDLKKLIDNISQHMQSQLSKQDLNFAKALAQMDHVQRLVNSPNQLLGSMKTKHGELAEQVEVAIQNSQSLLKGMGYCATANSEVVGRTVNAPVDYIINGQQIQSKFINSESKTLSHVIEHLYKYEKIGFARGRDSYYHIPKDQYEIIVKAIKMGTIENRRLSSVESIVTKVTEIERLTGRKFADVVRPSHVEYGEVQWGKINGTIEKIKFDINEENSSIVEKIQIDSMQKCNEAVYKHRATLGESIRVAGASAAVSGGISLVANVYKKSKEGKSIEYFTEEDWKEIGLDATAATIRGGVSGLAIYGLTNSAGMYAPIAAGTVSAVLGIGELIFKYNKNEITQNDLMEQGKLLCLNSVATTVGSVVGQQLIPIPVLGSVLGSIAGNYCVEIVTALLDSDDAKQIKEKYGKVTIIREHEERVKLFFEKYGELVNLTNLAFDFNSNYSLRLLASQEIARVSGVLERDILRNISEIDEYFLT